MDIESIEENFSSNSLHFFNDTVEFENLNTIISRHYFSHILLGIIGISICIIGILANIASIIILSRYKILKNLSTYVYLIALSLCDAIGLLFTVIVLIQYSVTPGTTGESNWMATIYPKLLVYVYPVVVSSQTLSVWITLALTIDRFLSVCKPQLSNKLCTKRRSVYVVYILFFLSLIYSLPLYFERNYEIVSLSNNKVILFSSLTNFGRSQTYFRIYHLYIYTIFICMIPFITIGILNSFLIHSVLQSNKQLFSTTAAHDLNMYLINPVPTSIQKESVRSTSEQDDESALMMNKATNINKTSHNNITILLIGLVIVFMICQLPSVILRLITFENREIIFNKVYVVLMDISNFLIVLNSTINCVLYTYTCTRTYPIYLVCI